jgi:hypothetical protein
MHFGRAVLLYFEIGFSPPAIVGEQVAIKPTNITAPMRLRVPDLTLQSFAEAKNCDKSGLDREADNWKS